MAEQQTDRRERKGRKDNKRSRRKDDQNEVREKPEFEERILIAAQKWLKAVVVLVLEHWLW